MALKDAGVTTRCRLWRNVPTTLDECAVVIVRGLLSDIFSLIEGDSWIFSFLPLTLPEMAEPSTCAGVVAALCLLAMYCQ